MYTIYEHKDGSTVYYTKTSHYNNKKITTCYNITYSKVKLNNKSYWILYDSNFKPISEAFCFINQEDNTNYSNKNYRKHSHNYAKTKLTALKYLFSYLELFDLSITDLNDNEISKFIQFLLGISMKGSTYTFNFVTSRNNASINRYLGVYRSFVAFLKFKNHPLLYKIDNNKILINTENDYTLEKTSHRHSLNEYQDDFNTPSYISIEDMDKIMKVIKVKYTYLESTLCKLLISTGLRIGEALGLTNEDLTELYGEPVLIVRNRMSDSISQNAKSCIPVYSKRTYQSKRYKNPVNGSQIIVITKEIENLLIEYINKAYFSSNKNYMKRIKETTTADTVNPSTYTERNFYIFVNTLGRPLSQDTWNKRLRKVFIDANIPIDKEKKDSGLSHRFRHGYATLLSKKLNLPQEAIKNLMRHRKFSTSEIYLKPTRKESIDQKCKIQSDVYCNLFNELEE